MADEAVGLGAFVEAAGAGLSGAQHALAGDDLDSTTMAVSEATLEARVALGVAEDGGVQVQPLDRKSIQSLGDKAASTLSTVTLNFVALTEPATAPTGTVPPLDKDKAIGVVAERPDVKRLSEILGPLQFQAAFIPERATWLVTASDESGRRVREVLIDKET